MAIYGYIKHSNNNHYGYVCHSELYHYGILGQKWGVRRYQNSDGSLTPAGKKRYSSDPSSDSAFLNKRGNKSLFIDQKKYNEYAEGVRAEESRQERIKEGKEFLKDADVLSDFDYNNPRVKNAIDFLLKGYGAYYSNDDGLYNLIKHRNGKSDEELAKRLLQKNEAKAAVAAIDLVLNGNYTTRDVQCMVEYAKEKKKKPLSKFPDTLSVSSALEEWYIENGM